jgi:hypothetical protein
MQTDQLPGTVLLVVERDTVHQDIGTPTSVDRAGTVCSVSERPHEATGRHRWLDAEGRRSLPKLAGRKG